MDVEIDVLDGGSHILISQHSFCPVSKGQHDQSFRTDGGFQGQVIQSRVIHLPLGKMLFQPGVLDAGSIDAEQYTQPCSVSGL